MSLRYRPEIDGLRTVAVIPVILFHSGLALPGGFVGVDVFFVISGFLITSILIDERTTTGRISILGFYERRARRIIPALVLVVAACLPLAWGLMLPSQLDLFGRSVAATILFASNVLYWLNSGYFAPSTELMPLLHTWSLAVEEQYYILFPLFLILCWRLGRTWLSLLMLACIAGSFALAEWLSHARPSAAFYLIPTRVWELLAGALLALWAYGRTPRKGALHQAASIAGLLAILAAIALFDKTTPWPGIWALAPVLGTVAIIWGGGETIVARALAWRPMVGMGLISYAAYLWHQPLFAFARLRGDPTPALMAALALLSLTLAWATWRFVERPFRNRAHFTRRWILGSTGLSILVLGLIGAGLAVRQGVPERFPDWQRAWLVPPAGGYGATVEQPYLRDLPPMGQATPKGAVLLVGDSFSQDFYNILRETDLLQDLPLHRHFIHNRCQLILSARRSPKIIAHQGLSSCAKSAITPQNVHQMAQYDTVLLVANWKDWSVSEGIAVAQAIEAQNGRVIFVGRKHFAEGGLRPFAGKPLADILAMRTPKPADITQMDQTLRQTFGDRFLSLMDALCNGPSCPQSTADGTPLSYDGDHLTPQGATHLAKLLTPRLKTLLTLRPASN